MSISFSRAIYEEYLDGSGKLQIQSSVLCEETGPRNPISHMFA